MLYSANSLKSSSGLRNPQELAFDQYGNLFTVENNSDSGDRARLVHIVAGGDSGWRTGYQYGSALSDRGPFNAEKIWHLPSADQPAYVVPPLAHITSGPSGFCCNYGATARPGRYADHFFICDFRGDAGNSGVCSFAVKPKGASFEVAGGHQFIWSILATACDVGPDLSRIALQRGREYLLELIVDPNRQIAQGYETVVLGLLDGKTVSGIIKPEDTKQVKLMTPEGKLVTVAKNRIEARERGQSAMPEDLLQHLSRRELRDLVEFLAGLK